MRLNRFVALAASALLVVGAMAAIAGRSFAMGSHHTASVRANSSIVRVQTPGIQAPTCAQDEASGPEPATAGIDTDKVDLRCGDQNAGDGQSAMGADAASNSVQDTVGAADTGSNIDQQAGDQSGDQNGPDTEVQAPESAN